MLNVACMLWVSSIAAADEDERLVDLVEKLLKHIVHARLQPDAPIA